MVEGTHSREIKRVRGFTLVEIMIAIVILATSLTVILGLQSAIMKRSIDDKSRLTAMLFARRILASLEASIDEIPFGVTNETVYEMLDLDNNRSGDTDSEEDSETALARTMLAELNVEPFGLPNNEEALKRITLSINWTDNPFDSIQIYYFTANGEGLEAQIDQ